MAEKAREPRSLTQVLRDRIKTKVNKPQPTHIENMSLMVQPGVRIDAPRAAIRGIHRAARAMVRYDGRIAKIEGQKNTRRKVLTDFAQDYPGFDGFKSKDDNMSVSVYREAEVVYHDKEIKEALGEAATAVGLEKLEFTFLLPLGHQTDEGVLTSEIAQTHIGGAIEGLNFPEDEVKKLLNTKVVYKPDEPTLFELLDNGQVVLPPEAATVIDSMRVRITPINKTLGMPPVA